MLRLPPSPPHSPLSPHSLSPSCYHIHNAPRPLASYKAAQRAIKSYRRGNDTDEAALAALAGCISSLEAQHASIKQQLATVAPWQWDNNSGRDAAAASPEDAAPDAKRRKAEAAAAAEAVAAAAAAAAGADATAAAGAAGAAGLVEHSFDLELGDPAFLAASALLSLGLLREARGDIQAAAAALDAALALFPAFIAARVAAARVALADAGDAAGLQVVEDHLSAAVDSARALAAAEDGLVVDSNKACAKELSAGDDARRALAMLLCQSGRDAEAAELLGELGFAWRLARGILSYPMAASGSDSSAGLPLAVLDNALPAPLLQRLQAAFSPGASFWPAHGYGPRQGYFSYAFSLVSRTTGCWVVSTLSGYSRTDSSPHTVIHNAPFTRPSFIHTTTFRRTRRQGPRCSRSWLTTFETWRCLTFPTSRRHATPSGGRIAAGTAQVRDTNGGCSGRNEEVYRVQLMCSTPQRVLNAPLLKHPPPMPSRPCRPPAAL